MTSVDRSIRSFLLQHIADEADVLDVGAGKGWATLLIARERPRCVVHGVDSEMAVVHQLSLKLRRLRRHGATRCCRCSAEQLADVFGARTHDVTVSVHALHHYMDPFKALQNVRRVLRPGGTVLIAEFDPLYGETLDDCPRFSLEKITWLCEDAGFQVRVACRKHPGVLLVAAER